VIGNLGLLKFNVNPESDTSFECFGRAKVFLDVPQKAARALIASTAAGFSILRKIKVAGPHLPLGAARLSLDISGEVWRYRPSSMSASCRDLLKLVDYA
jgi:hypothetical protein